MIFNCRYCGKDHGDECRAEEVRRMVCPYCGYECTTTSIGAVHCGPHISCHGGNTYPAVRMIEKQVGRAALNPKERA